MSSPRPSNTRRQVWLPLGKVFLPSCGVQSAALLAAPSGSTSQSPWAIVGASEGSTQEHPSSWLQLGWPVWWSDLPFCPALLLPHPTYVSLIPSQRLDPRLWGLLLGKVTLTERQQVQETTASGSQKWQRLRPSEIELEQSRIRHLKK